MSCFFLTPGSILQGKGGIALDQKKIGSFLKELRKEKGITQEQLAEELGVTGRTVSRWETGNNMPDISLLVDISDYYQVSIPEIIAGERKSETMNEEVKEVAEAMSDYAGQEKEKLVKSIRNLSIRGLVALVIYLVLGETGAYEWNTFFRCVYGISEALIYVTVVMFPLYTTGLLNKTRIRNVKTNHLPGPMLKVIGFVTAFAIAAVIRVLLSRLFG